MLSGKKAFDFVRLDMPLESQGRRASLRSGDRINPSQLWIPERLIGRLERIYRRYKFAGGSMRLLWRERVRQILRICHHHQVYVSTGGFIERVIIQGSEAVEQYLRECKLLGFDVVEVSSGMAQISVEDKIKIATQVQRLGMKPKPEVSMMIGAGAGTHVTGYKEGMKMRDFERLYERGRCPHQSRGRDDHGRVRRSDRGPPTAKVEKRRNHRSSSRSSVTRG